VTLVRVIDGDTLEVLAGNLPQSVRLIGINAPEEGECLADAAAAYLERLVQEGHLTLALDASNRDQRGRLLRYLWVDEVFVNEALVREGYALAARYPPDVALAERLEAAQTVAQRDGLGMWAADACGSASASAVVILRVEYDAPGDDALNLNEEWVLIRNDGLVPASLDGWVLKDRSATHRYHFPEGFTLQPKSTVMVHSGKGVDTATDLYWGHEGSGIWNNDGDTAFLHDSAGNMVASFSYGGGS
jgi:micrococcal nuclease